MAPRHTLLLGLLRLASAVEWLEEELAADLLGVAALVGQAGRDVLECLDERVEDVARHALAQVGWMRAQGQGAHHVQVVVELPGRIRVDRKPAAGLLLIYIDQSWVTAAHDDERCTGRQGLQCFWSDGL
jgi:hypothetical protein